MMLGARGALSALVSLNDLAARRMCMKASSSIARALGGGAAGVENFPITRSPI